MKFFIGEWFADNAIMRSYLDEVQFYSGTERRKMLNVPPSQGGSMLYGLTWRGYLAPGRTRTPSAYPKLYKTKVMDDYPKFEEIFKEFGELHFSPHKWSQTQMNRNFPCPKHKDSTNVGESVLCCFGDYEGGDTMVDYGNGEIQRYDAKERPVKFNGAKYTHWVEPITSGTRYSLVFFTNTSIERKKNLM